MIHFALALSFLFATPSGLPLDRKQSAEPTKAAQASALDPRYVPPPKAARWGPKIIIGTGAALAIAGMTGLIFGGGCQTRDAQDRCIDPYGGSTLYPSLVVLGLGVTITGGYWYRRLDTNREVRNP